MPLPLRQIRRRIRSVENTKKITRAMEMVAASKKRRFQDMLGDSDRYLNELKRLAGVLVGEAKTTHPLLETRPQPKTALVFLITSDTGLCGSHNIAILEQLRSFLAGESKEKLFEFVSIGKHGTQYLARTQKKIARTFAVPRPSEIDALISNVSVLALEQFSKKTADEVFFIFTEVRSLGSLKPVVKKFLPFAVENSALTQSAQTNYLLEPTPAEILDILIPELVSAEIGRILKQAFLAEQISRMLAMHQATDNASELIDSLTLARNKARQNSITTELIEVVSGSRALQRE